MRPVMSIDDASERTSASVVSDGHSILKAVRILKALATLCPMQPPLVAALARSGIAAAALMLCVQMLRHIPTAAHSSSSPPTSEVTLQPLVLMVDFCFYYMSNMATAAPDDLACLLEAAMLREPANCFVFDQTPGSMRIERPSPSSSTRIHDSPIDTPGELLSARAALVHEAEGTALAERNGSEAENDLMEMLTAAARAADCGAKWGSGATDDSAAVVGRALVDVGSRAQAVTRLLLLFEEHCRGQQGSAASACSAVPSVLFLRCLQSFVGGRHTESSIGAGGGLKLQRALSGLALMTLQNAMPLAALLRNGAAVVELAATILRGRAASLEIATADRDFESADRGGGRGGESTQRRPLIHVISSSDGSEHGVSAPTDDQQQGSSDDSDMVSCVLGIVTALLGMGSDKERTEREEAALRGLLHPLQSIAFREPDEEVARAASDAALLLLHRFSGGTSAGRGCDSGHTATSPRPRDPTPLSPFADVVAKAMAELCTSTEAPLRAMGVHTILVAIKDPRKVYMDAIF